jgi:hypothetical protein
VSKKLHKALNFIIFKEGKNKTIEFALNNNIKLVNPLFIHESVLKQEVQPWENFEIKKSYTELFLNSNINSVKSSSNTQAILNTSIIENKKRKFDQAFPDSKINNEENISKKKKVDNSNISSIKLNLNKEPIENKKSETEKKNIDAYTDKDQESKLNNKITNFFRPSAKSEIKINPEIKNIFSENPFSDNVKVVEKSIISSKLNTNSESIIISSISIGEEGKFKINNCVKSLGKYKYIGESLENIAQSEFIIVNEIFNKNDIRYLYCLFHDKKIIIIKFFIDSKNQNAYKFNLEDLILSNKNSNSNPVEEKVHNLYLKSFPIDLKSLEDKKVTKDFPFKEDKYKVHLHPSLYEKEPLRKEVYIKILEFLGLDLENNIRLSEICILNKEDISEYFPGHVRLLNESFLFDCLFNWKIMEMENIKYFPEKLKIKK